MTLVFATANRHKLHEASQILSPAGIGVISQKEAGVSGEAEETGSSFEENSLLKARYVLDSTGLDCFADDSGLEVDALGGAPGIYSARYASSQGGGHDHDANIDRLLRELEGVPSEKRTARFRCVVTLFLNGEPHVFSGSVEGRIATERSGAGGFGYDPVFIPEGMDVSMAEISDEEKNRISHRGRALREMAAWLSAR